jgi:hypothetical protein
MPESDTHNQKSPDLLLHHDVEEDGALALAKRLREAMPEADTNLDALTDLARDPKDKEQFDDLLEDLASESVMQDPEFIENIKRLRNTSISHGEDASIRQRQKTILQQHKSAVLLAAGLDEKDAEPQMEQYRLQIREQVKLMLESDPECGNFRVLEGLGIIVKKGEEEVYVWPEGLFPPTVDRKWQTYLSIVADHLRTSQRLQMGAGEVSQSEVVEHDRARRYAHNSVARDVHNLLGLYNLSDEQWDFEQTRGLLDKMRDNLFPHLNTDERLDTELAILKGAAGAHAVKALTRFSRRNHPASRTRI